AAARPGGLGRHAQLPPRERRRHGVGRPRAPLRDPHGQPGPAGYLSRLRSRQSGNPEGMAKQSKQDRIIEELHANGVRKRVATLIAGGRGGRRKGKKVAEDLLGQLDAARDIVKDEVLGGKRKRSAAGKKAAATRKRNAAKRSTAAKKSA